MQMDAVHGSRFRGQYLTYRPEVLRFRLSPAVSRVCRLTLRLIGLLVTKAHGITDSGNKLTNKDACSFLFIKHEI